MLASMLLSLGGASCGEGGIRVAVELAGLREQALLNDAELDGATLKVEGPGIDPAIEVNVDIAAESFEVSVPAGPARRFTLSAWRLDSEIVVPAFVGETTTDLTAGSVVSLDIAAYPVGLLVGSVQAPDGTVPPGDVQVTFTAGWVTPTLDDPVIATPVNGEVRVILGAGPYDVSASFVDGEALYELADLGPLALAAGERRVLGLYFVRPGTKCTSGFPEELWSLAPACRHVTVTVSGLAGTGLVLANGATQLSVPADGTYELPMGVADGTEYTVEVVTAPSGPSQTCVVSGGHGTVAGADVLVDVSCTTNRLPVSAVIHGLIGTGLRLTSSAGDVSVNEGEAPTVAFPQELLDASVVTVAVAAQPTASALAAHCAIDNGADLPTAAASFTLAGEPLTVHVYCVGAVAPLYASAPNWNDYAQLADVPNPDELDPSLSVCSDVSGPYDSCFHGGERRMIEVRDLTDCAGVTARDSLRAFDWVCRPFSGGVRLISTGLANGVPMSALLDFASLTWREEQVEIFDGARWRPSAVGSWWRNEGSNQVVECFGSSPQPGVVNVIRADPGEPTWLMSGAGTSVVVAPGVTLTTSIMVLPVILVQDAERSWVEATVSAAAPETAASGIEINRAPRTVLRNVEVSGGPAGGIAIRASSGVRLQAVRAHDNLGDNIYLSEVSGALLADLDVHDSTGGSGVFVLNSSSNRFTGITAYNNGVDGFTIDSDMVTVGSTLNVVTDILAHHNLRGIFVEGSPGPYNNSNTFARVRAYQNVDGIVVGDRDNVFVDVITAGNSGAGFAADTADPSFGTTLVGARVFDNQGGGINLSTPYARLAKVIAFNNAGANVTLSSSARAVVLGLTSANADTGLYLNGSSNVRLIDATLVNLQTPVQVAYSSGLVAHNVAAVGNDTTGFWDIMNSGLLTLTGMGLHDAQELCGEASIGSFCASVPAGTGTVAAADGLLAGPVFVDDGANKSDEGGLGPADMATADFINFDDSGRGWGIMPSASTPFPSVEQRGACQAGSDCRIFDLRVRAGSALHNAALPATWDTFAEHVWYEGVSVTQTDCDMMVPNTRFVFEMGMGRCVTLYLVGAVELMNDGVGNENALCEVDEACEQLPNLGGYQGEGALGGEQILSLSDGIIAGTITLYSRPNAGAP